MDRRLAGLAVLAAVLSCRAPSGDTHAPPTESHLEAPQLPRSIELPDLSGMRASVQAQLRRQFDSVTALAGQQGAQNGALAAGYGELGTLLLSAQCLDAAEASFRQARAADPNDGRWSYYLGHIARQRGAVESAVQWLEEANRLRPNDEPTLIWLGQLHLSRGDPSAAESFFASVAARNPKLVAARFGLGRVALARQDYGRAVSEFEQALALDPRAAGVHYPLALAYRGVGDREKSERHASMRHDAEVRAPDPLLDRLDELLESPASYERRGVRALEARDWASATEAFKKGLTLEPGDPSLHQRMSTALYFMGDRAGARRELDQALASDPGFAKAHFSLALLDDEEGRIRGALEHLNAAVGRDPSYLEARLRLGSVMRRVGQPRDAIAQYREAIRLDPRVVEARVALAMLLADSGRSVEARDLMIDSLGQIDAEEPAFAQVLARILATAQDPGVRDGARALSLAEALVTAQPTPDRAETMAMACAAVGRYADAVEWQRKAVDGAIRAGRLEVGERMRASLAAYAARRPARTPWRDDEFP